MCCYMEGRQDVLMWASGMQFMEIHMVVKPIVHEIRIQNQVIFLDPPIEYARATWIKQLHDWLGKSIVWHIRGMIRVYSCSFVLFRSYMSVDEDSEFEIRNRVADSKGICY